MQNYFAAANTSDGFVSWFDDIFPPEALSRTYILKGGSGTGKSTLIKRAAALCEQAGGSVERFYCSSDPTSLDGVLLYTGEKNLAILDGTSPHVRDPRYPGAAEEIVNLGAFWDENALTARREEIVKLTDRKAALFQSAYRELAAAGAAARAWLHEAGGAILHEKLSAAARRLLEKRMKVCHVKPSNAPIRRVRGLSAISVDGEVYFDGAREGYTICHAADAAGCLPMLFDALILTAEQLGLDYDVAPMPLLPEHAEAIWFPKLRLCILSKTASEAKALNMARFVNREALSERGRMRALRRMEREFTDAALTRLSEAKRCHMALEKIYGAAMDFDKLNAATDALLKKIFS